MYFSARALIAAASLMLPLAASATCWDEAGRGYGIDPLLLKAIAWKESRGWTGAVGPKLKDGNRALGLMQINTIHLPNLARFGNDVYARLLKRDRITYRLLHAALWPLHATQAKNQSGNQ